MMGIKSNRPGGADAGRGDVPHSDYLKKAIADRASQYGVPHAWVNPNLKDIGFSGRIVGFTDQKHITLSAESTGGGESDSHTIPFAHGFKDKTKFEQTYGPLGKSTVRMRAKEADGGRLQWTMHQGDK